METKLDKDPASTEKKNAPKIRGKRYQDLRAKVDKTKAYKLEDAVKLLKQVSYAKFDGSVEMHILVKKLGFSRKLKLPYSTGKTKRIEVANDKVIEKIKSGKIEFDVLLATAEMMPKLVPFAKILGPRGLMPNPKNGTLIKSEAEKDKFSADETEIATEKKQPVVHVVVGKINQKDKELVDNVKAIFDAIGVKQIVGCHLCSTMSPSVRVEVN